MNCSGNYNGNNAIGNGEVDSSILSGSTIFRDQDLASRSFGAQALQTGLELRASSLRGESPQPAPLYPAEAFYSNNNLSDMMLNRVAR
jgi:hypothetical protein